MATIPSTNYSSADVIQEAAGSVRAFNSNDTDVRTLAGVLSGSYSSASWAGKSSVTPWEFTKVSGSEYYYNAEGKIIIDWLSGTYSIGYDNYNPPPVSGLPYSEYGNIGSSNVPASDVEVKLTKVGGKDFSFAAMSQYAANLVQAGLTYTLGTYVSLGGDSYQGFVFTYRAYSGYGLYEYDITFRRKSTGQTVTRRISVSGE